MAGKKHILIYKRGTKTNQLDSPKANKNKKKKIKKIPRNTSKSNITHNLYQKIRFTKYFQNNFLNNAIKACDEALARFGYSFSKGNQTDVAAQKYLQRNQNFQQINQILKQRNLLNQLWKLPKKNFSRQLWNILLNFKSVCQIFNPNILHKFKQQINQAYMKRISKLKPDQQPTSLNKYKQSFSLKLEQSQQYYQQNGGYKLITQGLEQKEYCKNSKSQIMKFKSTVQLCLGINLKDFKRNLQGLQHVVEEFNIHSINSDDKQKLKVLLYNQSKQQLQQEGNKDQQLYQQKGNQDQQLYQQDNDDQQKNQLTTQNNINKRLKQFKAKLKLVDQSKVQDSVRRFINLLQIGINLDNYNEEEHQLLIDGIKQANEQSNQEKKQLGRYPKAEALILVLILSQVEITKKNLIQLAPDQPQKSNVVVLRSNKNLNKAQKRKIHTHKIVDYISKSIKNIQKNKIEKLNLIKKESRLKQIDYLYSLFLVIQKRYDIIFKIMYALNKSPVLQRRLYHFLKQNLDKQMNQKAALRDIGSNPQKLNTSNKQQKMQSLSTLKVTSEQNLPQIKRKTHQITKYCIYRLVFLNFLSNSRKNIQFIQYFEIIFNNFSENQKDSYDNSYLSLFTSYGINNLQRVQQLINQLRKELDKNPQKARLLFDRFYNIEKLEIPNLKIGKQNEQISSCQHSSLVEFHQLYGQIQQVYKFSCFELRQDIHFNQCNSSKQNPEQNIDIMDQSDEYGRIYQQNYQLQIQQLSIEDNQENYDS